MKRWMPAFFIVTALFTGAGCGVTSTGTPPAGGEARVYAATLAHLVGAEVRVPYGDIIVVDHPVANASSPSATNRSDDGPLFSSEVKHAIAERMAKAGPVRFVGSPREATPQSRP